MNYIVRIRVRKPTRVFTFQCGQLELKRDDPCVVRTDRGLEFGQSILDAEPAPDDAEDRFPMRVVREASDHDVNTQRQIEYDEQTAFELGAERIKEHRLPMKLIDVEYTFDRHKVVFYFTAADRVDFRELVRDLAQDLKARIELRHIQVRDEAKIVGGIGVCGRELCCCTWLTDFKPISMKMAKRQNLSLNPNKISGQCGRLLCCLRYENDQYDSRKKRKKQEEDKEAHPPAKEGERPPKPETVQAAAPKNEEQRPAPAKTARPEGTKRPEDRPAEGRPKEGGDKPKSRPSKRKKSKKRGRSNQAKEKNA